MSDFSRWWDGGRDRGTKGLSFKEECNISFRERRASDSESDWETEIEREKEREKGRWWTSMKDECWVSFKKREKCVYLRGKRWVREGGREIDSQGEVKMRGISSSCQRPWKHRAALTWRGENQEIWYCKTQREEERRKGDGERKQGEKEGRKPPIFSPLSLILIFPRSDAVFLLSVSLFGSCSCCEETQTPRSSSVFFSYFVIFFLTVCADRRTDALREDRKTSCRKIKPELILIFIITCSKCWLN